MDHVARNIIEFLMEGGGGITTHLSTDLFKNVE